MAGELLETWVVTELLKYYLHNGLSAPLYHYRDRCRREVDLLVVGDGVVHPVEVRCSASPRPEDACVFAALERVGATLDPVAVMCLVDRAVPLTRAVTALPAGAL